ncbi:trans-sialidase, putative, partial [Trypanosoma cruzi marinkellei]
MSRHLFYSPVLLLVVVMMCCNTGGAAEEQQSTGLQLEWKDLKDEGGVTVNSLGVPGLLKVENDIFAVAEAQCNKGGGDTFTGIASQRLTEATADKPKEMLKEGKDYTQILEKGGSAQAQIRLDVSRPTTVVNGSDIYMLVGKCRLPVGVGAEGDAGGCGLMLVKGNVNGEKSGGGRRIQWSDTNGLPRISIGQHYGYLTGLIGGGGSGVHTKDGKLLFPVEGTKKESEDEKTVSLIISSLKDTKSWKLSNWMSDDGCSDPSVVEWEDNQLMMMTACDDGRRRVYESGDKGESWTEALGTLSRVWGNKQGGSGVRSGFITATIDDGYGNNRKVMLVTLPVYTDKVEKDKENEKSELHLWLTDNTHIVDIGPVSSDAEDVTASSLLYKSGGTNNDNEENKEELIALYEKKKSGGESSHSLWSVLLTAQLQRVKKVLATWKKADDIVSKLCPTPIVAVSAPTTNVCSAGKVTAGLVGFLSGNFADSAWRDEYLGVNATVHNNNGGAKATSATVTEPPCGVTFRGAWAEWPVGEQGENQRYHFANYNFTLVATVSIHNVPQEGSPIPLMGVKMKDAGNTVLLGLSYKGGGTWILLCSGTKVNGEHSSTLHSEADTTQYHVAIVLQNGTQGT